MGKGELKDAEKAKDMKKLKDMEKEKLKEEQKLKEKEKLKAEEDRKKMIAKEDVSSGAAIVALAFLAALSRDSPSRTRR